MSLRIDNQRMDGSAFSNCTMAQTVFDNVNLRGARFRNMNLADASLDDVNFSDVRIARASIEGLTIYGYDSHALLQPLLARDAGQKAGKKDD